MKKTILLFAIVILATSAVQAPSGEIPTGLIRDLMLMSYHRGYRDALKMNLVHMLAPSTDMDSMVSADTLRFMRDLDEALPPGSTIHEGPAPPEIDSR